GNTNDIRDSDLGYTVRFQRYEFIHQSRYFVMDFRVANAAGVQQFRIRLHEGNVAHINVVVDRSSGLVPLVVDLGTPTYERRSLDLRIGWNLSWGTRDDRVRFRVNRTFLADEY